MTRPRLDLEVWLLGTPAELVPATAALRRLGRISTRGRTTPLAGADAGRARRYLRITLHSHPARGSAAA